MTQRPLLAATAAALLGAASAGAQVTTVDEGGFTITVHGQPAGREQFTIRSTPVPGGAEYVASAAVTLNERRLSPALRTDSAGAPLRYQVEVKVGPETQEKLVSQMARGRVSARIQTRRGEAAKEFIVAEGALILDDDVFHQYFFLARRPGTGTVPVVVPRRNVQVAMRVERAGAEQVTVGGRALDATHLVLSEPGGARRDIWVDAAGRVLKVEIPARGLVALRDDPPR